MHPTELLPLLVGSQKQTKKKREQILTSQEDRNHVLRATVVQALDPLPEELDGHDLDHQEEDQLDGDAARPQAALAPGAATLPVEERNFSRIREIDRLFEVISFESNCPQLTSCFNPPTAEHRSLLLLILLLLLLSPPVDGVVVGVAVAGGGGGGVVGGSGGGGGGGRDHVLVDGR